MITVTLRCTHCAENSIYSLADLDLFVMRHPANPEEIMAAAFVFHCPRKGCEGVPDQIQRIALEFAHTALAGGMIPVETDVLPKAPMQAMNPFTIRIVCNACNGESEVAAHQLVLRVARGIITEGEIETICPLCDATIVQDGLGDAMITLYTSVGIPREPWAKRAIAFPCGTCGNMTLVETVGCFVTVDALPTPEWKDRIRFVHLVSRCPECQTLTAFPLELAQHQAALVAILRGTGFGAGQSDVTWACKHCGIITADDFSDRDLVVLFEIYINTNGSEVLIAVVTCPRCMAFMRMSAREPEITELFKATGFQWIARLFATMIDPEEAEQLFDELASADPEDFTDSEG